MAARPPLLRHLAPRVLLALVSLGLTLGAVELGLRTQAWLAREVRLDDLVRNERFVAPDGRPARLGDIIRPSPDPEVVYELIPGTDTRFKARDLHINAGGFRGPAVAEAKPAGTIRIVGLGDSVMFGSGVADRDPYLAVLGRLLDEREPAVSWEVINLGVPGYNTTMEIAAFERLGVPRDPDLVVLGFVSNDFGLPNFVLEHEDPWTSSRSHLWDLLRGRAGLAGARLVRRPAELDRTPGDQDFETRIDRERVPEVLRTHIGPEGFRRAIGRLAALRDEHGFEVLVFFHRALAVFERDVQSTLERYGIPWLSAHEDNLALMRRHGVTEWRGSELTVGPDDPHPSALWHAALAETLLRHLTDDGTLARLIARAEWTPRRAAAPSPER